MATKSKVVKASSTKKTVPTKAKPKLAVKKTAAKKVVAVKAKTSPKKVVANAKKSPVKKIAPKKVVAKKVAAKKVAAKKVAPKKIATQKAPIKKIANKPVKKVVKKVIAAVKKTVKSIKPIKKQTAKAANKSLTSARVKKPLVKKVVSKKPAIKKVAALKTKVAVKKTASVKKLTVVKTAKKVPTKSIVVKHEKPSISAKKVVKTAPKPKKAEKVLTPKVLKAPTKSTEKENKPNKMNVEKISFSKAELNLTTKPVMNQQTVAEKIELKRAAPMMVTPDSVKRNVIGPVPSIPPYRLQSGETYMNDAQVAHFRHVLITWKQELMEEVDKTVGHMQDDAENYADPNDRATQEEEFSLELRTRDRERKLMKKIEEAIVRIDSDEFGYCEACGVEIGLPRLEARPTATLCIDCKTVEELREKQITV